MNWKEIEEKYPKAWIELLSSGINCIDFPGHPDYGCPEETRDLYDFFDEQDIKITIHWYYMKGVCKTEDGGQAKYSTDIIQWIFAINKGNQHPNFNSRPEAEEQAFLKAFEILEEKLK